MTALQKGRRLRPDYKFAFGGRQTKEKRDSPMPSLLDTVAPPDGICASRHRKTKNAELSGNL